MKRNGKFDLYIQAEDIGQTNYRKYGELIATSFRAEKVKPEQKTPLWEVVSEITKHAMKKQDFNYASETVQWRYLNMPSELKNKTDVVLEMDEIINRRLLAEDYNGAAKDVMWQHNQLKKPDAAIRDAETRKAWHEKTLGHIETIENNIKNKSIITTLQRVRSELAPEMPALKIDKLAVRHDTARKAKPKAPRAKRPQPAPVIISQPETKVEDGPLSNAPKVKPVAEVEPVAPFNYVLQETERPDEKTPRAPDQLQSYSVNAILGMPDSKLSSKLKNEYIAPPAYPKPKEIILKARETKADTTQQGYYFDDRFGQFRPKQS